MRQSAYLKGTMGANDKTGKQDSKAMTGTSTITTFVIVLLYTIGFPKQALAYLDPGSGSMMLQLMLGGAAGFIVVLKLYWKSFVNLFQRKNHLKDSITPYKLDK
jgi:hypothetical protein